MGLEFSAFELGALSGIVQNQLADWYVNNVYPLTEQGLVLRFHRAEMEDKNLAVHTKLGIWVTSESLPREPDLTDFCRAAREYLSRLHLKQCYCIKGERVVVIEFGDSNKRFKLFAEFFAAGNMIITDEDMKILAVMNEIRSENRSLTLGSPYQIPRAKKIPLDSLTANSLLETAKEGFSLSSLLGKVVQLPSRILKEAVLRTGLPEYYKLDYNSAQRLVASLMQLQREALQANRFYIYENEKEKILSAIELTHLGKPSETFSADQVDRLFNHYAAELISASKIESMQAKIQREKKRIESAKKMYQATLQKSEKLREVAESIISGKISPEEAASILYSEGSNFKYINGVWFVDGKKKDFKNAYSLASEIFSESKRLKASAEEVKRSIEKMEKALNEIEERAEIESPGTSAAKTYRKRWFEDYRWFFTTESFLAIGGRDAGSNSLLIRKKMDSEDLVFHAELIGSPFFLLKRGKNAGEASLTETAIATVCYSRAWREGLRAADAYYVEPHQVRLGAPSGMYMPRGSFLIEGQKKYLKDLKLVLGVGVTKIDGFMRPCSGPSASLTKYSPIIVEITPGILKPLQTAKKIVKIIREHLRSTDSLEPDEFIRVLPPGNSDVLGVKKGEGESIPSSIS